MKSSCATPRRRGCRWGFEFVATALLAGTASAQTSLNPLYYPCVPYDWGSSGGSNGYISQTTIFFKQEDINQYLNCTEIYQSIKINTYNISELNLNNIETFHGSLKIEGQSSGVQLERIIAPNLKTVVQAFSLSNFPQLQDLQIPLLQSVATVSWIGLASLKALPWSPRSVSISLKQNNVVSSELIVQGTGLETLDCFSFIGNTYSSDTVVAITNNINLSKLDLGTIISGPGNLTIKDNESDLQMDLGNMTTAGNITFSKLRSLEMPALTNTTGDLTLSRNAFTQVQLPLLDLVGGSLSINSNQNLAKMDFPQLSKIGFLESGGDLNVLDNPALNVVDGFESFDFAFGSLNFRGNFSIINLPVDNVERFSDKGIHIDSSDPGFNCSYWTLLVEKQWPNADSRIYTCHAPNSNSSDASLNPADADGKTSLTKDIYNVLIGVSILIVVFAGGIAWHYFGIFKRRKVALEEARRRHAEGIELGLNGRQEAGVVRRVEDDPDRPPTYSRVPKPGEVPPCYLEVMDSNDSGNRDSNTADAVVVSNEPQEPPPAFVEPPPPVVEPSRPVVEPSRPVVEPPPGVRLWQRWRRRGS